MKYLQPSNRMAHYSSGDSEKELLVGACSSLLDFHTLIYFASFLHVNATLTWYGQKIPKIRSKDNDEQRLFSFLESAAIKQLLR